MKKYLIPALLLPIGLGTLLAVHHSSSVTKTTTPDTIAAPVRIAQENTRTFVPQSAAPQQPVPVASQQTTKISQPVSQSFTPQFTPVTIPDEAKQQFTVNPKTAQTAVGSSGTLLLIPSQAFKTKSGKPVEGNVKLQLVEGIATADILKMSLGTMSDHGMLETGGMIRVGATDESGEELMLADGKVLDVEIPTLQKKAGMQLWEGKEQADGSVLWQNPKPLNDGLREVPVESLEEGETKIQPVVRDVRKYPAVIADKRDKGRLSWAWYTLSDGGDSIFYDWRTGQPTDSNVVLSASSTNGFRSYEVVRLDDEKFRNTNIATVEFRSRLPIIKQACDARVMACYTDFPTRALWKSDAAAADTLDKSQCPLADVFRQFAQLKQSNVDPKDPSTAAALDQARTQAIKNYSKRVLEQAQANNARNANAYSFRMTTLGWANCDALFGAADSKMMRLNTRIGGSIKSPITTSLIVPGRNVFIQGYRRPNGTYAYTHGEGEEKMACPVGEKAYILAKTGSGNNCSYALKAFTFGDNELIDIELAPGSEAELDATMAALFSNKDRVLDDWYTQSLQKGSGCVCNEGWGAWQK